METDYYQKIFQLKHDKNIGVAVFATEKMTKTLSECSAILCDGIFKSCPPPFYQLFTIHSLKIYRKIPLIWEFADGKTTAHYRKIFQIVKSKIGSLPKLFPVLKGQYLGLWKRNFHTVLTKGATFISTQAIYWQIQKLAQCSVQRRKIAFIYKVFNGDPFFCPPPVKIAT